MAQAKSDMSINMEISNGAVIHCPVGSCMEMEDRRTGEEEEEEEDDVELAEEVDEDMEDGGEDNVMPSTDVIVHKTEQEDIIEDLEHHKSALLQNEEVKDGKMEDEVDINGKLTRPELPVELSITAQTQVQSQAEVWAGAFKELDDDRADHKLETLYEDEKESDEQQVHTLSVMKLETQELLFSEVRELTFCLLEKIEIGYRDDQMQQVKNEIVLQEEEHGDVKNDEDKEPPVVSTGEAGSGGNFQSLGEEPTTFDNNSEEQSMTEVPLFEDCKAIGEPMHDDATNSDDKAAEERGIDWIAKEQPEEMVQNSDQLAESIVQEHETLECLQQVVGDRDLENCEGIVADTQSAIVNGPEETRGDKKADKEVEGIERIQRGVEITKEELCAEEGSCTEVEQPPDAPEIVEGGACRKQEQLGNDKREVAEGDDGAKEQPRQVNEEVPIIIEEGVCKTQEQLSNGKREVAKGGDGAKEQPRQVNKEVPIVIEEGTCKTQEQLDNGKREVAEGGDGAKEQPRQVNKEVPIVIEEGACKTQEQLNNGKREVAEGGDGAKEQPRQVKKEVPIVIEEGACKTQEQLDNGKREVAEGGDGAKEQPRQVKKEVPIVIEEGTCKTQEQLDNGKREVVEGGDGAKEQPRQVKKEVPIVIEEGACKTQEQLDNGKREVAEGGDGAKEQPRQVKKEVPIVIEEGACKTQEQLDNGKREVAEGGDGAKEQPRQVKKEVPTTVEEGVGKWLEELKAVIEDEPRRKAQGGRKVTIPAWLKTNESSDAPFQEPTKPLGSQIRAMSGGSEGEVNTMAKGQEVTMANGFPGIPPAVVQQDDVKPLVKPPRMAAPAQQEGDPQDQQISLYVKGVELMD